MARVVIVPGGYVEAPDDVTDEEVYARLGFASPWAAPGAPAENGHGFTSDIARSFGNMTAGTGRTLEDIGLGRVGASLRGYGERLQAENPSEIGSLSDVLDKPLTTLREGVGEMAPQGAQALGLATLGRVGGAMLGGPAGGLVGQYALPFAATLAQEYGLMRQDQVAEGREDKSRALLAAVPAAGLEFLGGERLLAGVPGGRNLLRGGLARRALTAGVEEGLTEMAQTPLERAGAFREPFSAEGVEEAFVGGVKGFAGGSAAGVATRRRPEAPPVLPATPLQMDLLAGQGELFPGADLGRRDGGLPFAEAPAQMELFPDELSEQAVTPARMQDFRETMPAQRDLFRQEPPEVTAQPGDIRQPTLFDDRPGAEVITDFDTRRVRARLRAAVNGESLDSYGERLVGMVTSRLAGNKVDVLSGELSALTSRLDTLERKGAKTEKAALARQRHRAMLDAARSTMQDYAARMADAQRQEGAAQVSRAAAQARLRSPTPGVTLQAPLPASVTEAELRRRNATAAAQEALAQEQVTAQERAVQERALFEGAVQDATATVQGRREQETAQRRDTLLQRLLDDPETVNPMGRFVAALRREGYRNIAPTEAEARKIAAFEDARAAFTTPEVEPSAPNEGGDFGIPERKAPVMAEKAPPRGHAPVAVAAQPGFDAANFRQLVAQAASKYKNVFRRRAFQEGAEEVIGLRPADLAAASRLGKAARLAREEGQQFARQVAERQHRTDQARALVPDEAATTFLSTKGAPAGMPAQRVREIVDRATHGWRGGTVIVVDDYAALPNDEAGRAFVEASAQGGYFVDGLYHGPSNNIYIIAKYQRDESSVLATLYHEGLGHMGLEMAFGERKRALMLRIYATNARIRADAQTWAGGQGFQLTDNDALTARAVEEVLAETMETGRAPQMSLVQQVVALVRDFGRRLGLRLGYTESDIRAILHRSAGVVNGKGRALPVHTPGSTAPGAGAGDAALRDLAHRRGGKASFTRLRSARAAEKDAALGALMEGFGVSDWWETVKDKAGRPPINLMTMYQIVENYAKRIPGLTFYYDTVSKAATRARHKTNMAFETSDKWRRIRNAEVRQELGAVLHESSFHQVDPRYGVKEIVNEETRNDGLSDDQVAVHADLRARFLRLPPEARALADDVFNAFRENLTEKQALFEKMIEGNAKLSDDEKTAMKEQNRHYFRRIKVYFPLMRFGKYIVVARSPDFVAADEDVSRAREQVHALRDNGAAQADIAQAEQALEAAEVALDRAREGGYAVEARETEAAMRQVQQRYQQQGFEVSLKYSDKSDFDPYLDNVSSDFMRKMEQGFDVYSDETGRKIANDMKSLMRQIYFQTLPETHALKRTLRRKYVAGYDKNAERTFAAAMIADAHHIAKLEFGHQTRDALENMRQQAAKSNDIELQQVVSTVRKHHGASLRITHTPVQDKITNLGYLWFLGFTPSFLLLNTLQVPLVTAPMMAARYGLRKTSSALTKALKEVSAVQITTWRQGGWRAEVDIDALTADPAERDMLRKLTDRGRIDQTQGHDLGAVASGQSSQWQTMMKAASFLPHYTEKANRLATALAAHRLAKETGDVDPVRFAEKMILDSHFDYSLENAPYWFKILPAGKVLLQFKKYQQAMAYAIVRNAALGWFGKGDVTLDERRLARRTLHGLLLSHGLAAGSLGLPGVSLITAAAGLIGSLIQGEDEEPWDPVLEWRNFLTDVFGADVGDVFAHGIGRAPGIRDMAPGDVSRRVGLHDVFDPVRTRYSSNEGRDKFNEYIAALLGPIGAIGGDMAEAARYWNEGYHDKGVEMALPKFARDVLRAERFAREGVTTTRGQTIIEPQQLSQGDIITQALGVTPTRLAQFYEDRQAFENRRYAQQDIRAALLRDYSEAVLRQDAEATEKTKKRIADYNAARRKNRQPILDGAALRRAVQERRRYKAQLKNGVRVRKGERALYEDTIRRDVFDGDDADERGDF